MQITTRATCCVSHPCASDATLPGAQYGPAAPGLPAARSCLGSTCCSRRAADGTRAIKTLHSFIGKIRCHALGPATVTFFRSFIDSEMQLHGKSSVLDRDSLRMLLPPTMRLQIYRIHALSQLQPDAVVFHLPSCAKLSSLPLLNIAYFSLQFSPKNSLNGSPSGIFRRAKHILFPLLFASSSFISFSAGTTASACACTALQPAATMPVLHPPHAFRRFVCN